MKFRKLLSGMFYGMEFQNRVRGKLEIKKNTYKWF